MRVVFGLLVLSSVGACASERGLAPQHAPAPAVVRVTSHAISAPRPVLWVVNGRVFGRAADPSSLTSDRTPLDSRLVESVEILKGRAAVAEFGEAGEAGAIVVRTRQVLR